VKRLFLFSSLFGILLIMFLMANSLLNGLSNFCPDRSSQSQSKSSYSSSSSVPTSIIERKPDVLAHDDHGSNEHQHEEKLLPIVTFADSTNMKFLRELVGASKLLIYEDLYDNLSYLHFLTFPCTYT
jgi:hypothetical protein